MALVRGKLLRMLTQPIRQPLRKVSYEIASHKPVTMDDLPLPAGSWQKAHDSKQVFYNIFLASSIIFYSVTMVVGIKTGTLDLYLGPALKNKD